MSVFYRKLQGLTNRKQACTRILLVVTGILFGSAGFFKAYDSVDLKLILLFDGLPGHLVPVFAWGVILLEIALGLSLILDVGGKVLTRITLAVLIFYSAQLGILLAFRQPPSCSCLGKWKVFQSNRKEAMLGLARNTFLISGFIWMGRRKASSDSTKGIKETIS